MGTLQKWGAPWKGDPLFWDWYSFEQNSARDERSEERLLGGLRPPAYRALQRPYLRASNP